MIFQFLWYKVGCLLSVVYPGLVPIRNVEKGRFLLVDTLNVLVGAADRLEHSLDETLFLGVFLKVEAIESILD